ncbi:MAG: tetratricopeptide repeat protein [Planctomycetota bacterium]
MMRVLGIFVLVAIWTPWAGAQVEAERAFHRGSELFDKGDFAAAAKAWEEALAADAGGPTLHFNLGTAYLRLGRNGPALHQLLVAERFDPRDEDITTNLALARKRLGRSSLDDRPTFIRTLLWLHEKTTPKEALSLFAVLWFVAFALLILRRAFGRPQTLGLAMSLIALGLILAFSLCARHFAWWSPTQAVVLQNATAFTGPSETTYQPHFKLPEGAEVEVLESKDTWLKVKAGDQQGFLPASQLGLIP